VTISDITSQVELPRLLGYYHMLEKIGKGGMGTVYRARHATDGRIVAVKVARTHVIQEPVLLARFAGEYDHAKLLRHSNLVEMLGYEGNVKYPYLVMEYVDGPSLEQRLKQQPPMDQETAVAWALQIADALSYLHRNHIIHRDIKPANILFTSKNQAKLGDLGLMKDTEASALLTQSNTGLGTANFAPPEQFENARRVDPRSDLYALAGTLFFALTGECPFGTGGPYTILQRKLDNQFVSPRHLVAGLSDHVDAAIRMALNADPLRRPKNARAFADMLAGKRLPDDLDSLPGLKKTDRRSIDTRTLFESKWKDRRVAVRHPVEMRLICSLYNTMTDVPLPCHLVDVSTHGLCMTLCRHHKQGTVLEVRVNDDSSVAFPYPLIVRWVRPHGLQWMHGCAFETPLAVEQLEDLCLATTEHTSKLNAATK
jgi:serine/threonine protein kinase